MAIQKKKKVIKQNPPHSNIWGGFYETNIKSNTSNNTEQ